MNRGHWNRAGAAALAALVALAAAWAPVATAQPVTLVARQSSWRWFAGNAQPAADWQNPGFDDTGWAAGPGPLGYGEAFIATTVPWGPSSSSKWITTYFRKSFTFVGDPSAIETLRMTASFDDGFVAYLNGIEVARRAMPAGPVSWGTYALLHEAGTYEAVDLSHAIPFLNSGANVLAVEVHQTSVTSTDLAWDADLIHSVPVQVVRGPYLQNGAPDAITVRWRTDLATTSRVTYGVAPGPLTLTADDLTPTTEHEVRLGALAPYTEYQYAIGSTGTVLAGGDAAHRFVTHPVPGAAPLTRVWVIGDAGRANADQIAVREGYETWLGSRRTDLWLMLGDNAYHTGTDAEYEAAVFDMYPELLRTSVSWPTRGNHDEIHSGAANDYYDLFTLPTAGEAGGVPSGTEEYYSFDYGDVHFVCLDSEGLRGTHAGMKAWLRADLAATDRQWVVAFWHHPPYSKGSHDSDDESDSNGRMGDMRRHILPILDSTGVDLVLTGHSHSYERSFLIDGHHGHSSTLAPSHVRDGGDGRPDGDGAYAKPTPGTAPFEGAVYVVAGSSGEAAGGALNHPVMIESLNELGSLVLDFDGPVVDGRFLSTSGTVRDSFRIVKATPVSVDGGGGAPAARLALRVEGAHPAQGQTTLAFVLPAAGAARLDVVDAAGRRVARLASGARAPGAHRVHWNGADARGRAAAPGVYFAVLEWNGERRAVRVVLER